MINKTVYHRTTLGYTCPTPGGSPDTETINALSVTSRGILAELVGVGKRPFGDFWISTANGGRVGRIVPILGCCVSQGEGATGYIFFQVSFCVPDVPDVPDVAAFSVKVR